MSQQQETTSIFLLGATGYIGGTVLAQLLASNNKYKITTLTRDPQKTQLLEKEENITALQGSLNDLDILEKEAAANDVTIHCAHADDLDAAKAIIRGLRKGGGRRTGGQKRVYIHTSGTGVLADDARGVEPYAFGRETVFDDADVGQVNSLPDTALHRNVDLEVLGVSEEVNAHIILPSTIWGYADHEFVKKGISNHQSIQVPALIRASVDRGQAGIVGLGKNVWPNVNINEVAEIYTLLLSTILTNQIPESTKSGSYFFGENGEHTLLDVGKSMGAALSESGIGDAEPTSFTEDEIRKYFGGSYYLGSNSRARGSRARKELGWKPQLGIKEFLESVKQDVEGVLQEDRQKWGFGGRL